MAELTEAQYTAKIAAIDTKMDALIESPESAVDYKMGQKAVSNSQKVKGLLSLREHYVTLRDRLPYEDVSSFDYDITEFGEDRSNEIGDVE